jgi:hypothetical protein
VKTDYWQKRTVKAEETLIKLKFIAEANGYTRVEEMIDSYFKLIAAGEVNNVVLGGDKRE